MDKGYRLNLKTLHLNDKSKKKTNNSVHNFIVRI